MTFETFEEIIKYAVEKEVEAAEFYENAKDEENMASMKDVLSEFAVEERKHQAMLEDIAGNKEKIENYQLKSIPDLKISDSMTELTYKPGMFLPDLLVVAMKREEQAYKFYSDLAEKTTDEEFGKIFKILAQEESKHKNILETKYDDFLASQAG